MEYYGDDDYNGSRSPGLEPVIVKLEPPASPSFSPFWMPRDIADAPLDSSQFEHGIDGLTARKKLYAHFSDKADESDWLFADTVLLHHMNPTRPDISIALAKAPLIKRSRRGVGSDSDSDSDDDLWPTPMRSIKPSQPSQPPQPILSRSKLTARQPGKTRLGLPITLNRKDAAATVLACADTGAEVNIMSDELAQTLGYTDYGRAIQRTTFELANGNTVESIGQVSASCSFGVEADITAAMSCIFHVFLHAASPIIMGMAFLEKTKTMTEHRNRLVRVPRPNFQALSICTLGRPRQLLSCELNEKPTLVTLDSGSDIDVMSPRFAREQGFVVHPEEHAIEQADGSLAIISGFVHLTLSIARPNGVSPPKPTHTEADFFLLEGLIHDAIVGEDSQVDLDIFGQHQHAIISASDVAGPLGIARIRYLSTMDRMVSWVKNKIFGKKRALNEQATPLQSQDVHDDQRENARREAEERRIASLRLDQRDAAIETEALRRQEYERKSQLSTNIVIPTRSRSSSPSNQLSSISQHNDLCRTLTASTSQLSSPFPRFQSLPSPSPLGSPPSLVSGVFNAPHNTTISYVCDQPGCNVAPFQTQYLLNSHQNVHSQSRSHLCPVQGCPRGKVGLGFMRKNELIRHGLVHQAPGYICPFCPDRESKYHIPDNLLRHVRVHHMDKDKDDPQLRDLLIQRGKRVRRRIG